MRSPYILALQADHEDAWGEGSSRMPGGQRSLHK
jgi:hypothetical protein